MLGLAASSCYSLQVGVAPATVAVVASLLYPQALLEAGAGGIRSLPETGCHCENARELTTGTTVLHKASNTYMDSKHSSFGV